MTVSCEDRKPNTLVLKSYPKVEIVNIRALSNRGLTASDTLSHLEEIMRVVPYAKVYNDKGYGGSDSNYSSVCDVCGTYGGDYLIKCACNYVAVCDLSCMQRLNEYHPQECFMLRTISKLKGYQKSIPELVRLLIRVYCSTKDSSKLVLFFGSYLTSHYAQIMEEMDMRLIEKTLTVVTVAADSFAKNYEKDPVILTNDNRFRYILELFCVCIVNATTITNTNFEKIGICLDPNFALINHSCIPNTLAIPNSNSFSVVSTRKIPANKEITTTYCYVNQPKFLRQHELRTKFFFNCSCPLCVKKHDFFFSFNCPHCGELFCSLNWNSVVQDTVEIEFKNEASSERCIGCSKVNDLALLKRIYSILKMLVWYLLICGANLVEEILEAGDINSLITKVQEVGMRIKNKSHRELVDLLLSTSMLGPIKTTHIPILKQAIHEIMKSKMVPEYVYPVNNYLTNFLNYFDEYQNSKMDPLDLRFLHLKESLQVSLMVEIASDLSDVKLIRYYKYLAIAGELVEIFKAMRRSRLKKCQVWDLMSFDLILNVIAKLALFFSLQALEWIITTTSFQLGMRTTPEWYIQNIQYFASTQILLSCDWDLKNAKDFTNHRFMRELKQLFTFADIRYHARGNDIKIQFANRTRGSLFQPLSTLKCKCDSRFQRKVLTLEDHQNFKDFSKS